MFGYSASINTGPEFNSQEKCERAVAVITQSANDHLALGMVRKPWCVRIDK